MVVLFATPTVSEYQDVYPIREAESATTWRGALAPIKEFRIWGTTPIIKPTIFARNTHLNSVQSGKKYTTKVVAKMEIGDTAAVVEGAKTAFRFSFLDIIPKHCLILSDKCTCQKNLAYHELLILHLISLKAVRISPAKAIWSNEVKDLQTKSFNYRYHTMK